MTLWVVAGLGVLVPLAVSPLLADSYTLPKLALVRAATGVLMFLWGRRLLFERRAVWARTPLDWVVAAFMAAAVLATIFSTNPRLSVFGHYKRYEDVFTLVGYGVLYFAVANNLKPSDVGKVITAWLGAAGVVSGYAVLQYAGLDWLRNSGPPGRSISALGNAVFLGNYLALVLPVAAARFLLARSRAASATYIGLIVLISAGLALSFSRGAWVGALVGLAVLAIRAPGLNFSRKNLGIAVALVLSVFLAANFYPNPANRGSLPLVGRAVSSLDTSAGSVKTRLLIWRTTLGMIARRPLLGYGPDTLVFAYSGNLPDDYKKLEPQARIDKAHNELLNVGATLGLVGLGVYLAVILFFLQAAWATSAPGSGNREPAVGEGVGLAAGLIGYMAAVQFSFSQVEVAVFFWIGLAMTLVALGAVRQSEPRPITREQVAPVWLALGAATAVYLAFLYFSVLLPLAADHHFQRALQAENRGQMRTARAEFDKAATISKVRSVYFFRLGRRYQLDAMEAKPADTVFVKRSLAAYAKAEALDPVDPNVYTAIGSLYTFLGRSDKRFNALAEESYRRSLALNPYVVETYVDLGVLMAQTGRPEAAVAGFKQALKLDPGNGVARANLKLMKAR